MKLFNGHDLKTGDKVVISSRHESPTVVLISHACARFIHVGGMIFWKTSGQGANLEAVGYKIEKMK